MITSWKSWRRVKALHIIILITIVTVIIIVAIKGSSSSNWNLIKAHESHHIKSWYDHTVLENENTKIVWHFHIKVDKFIGAIRLKIAQVRQSKKSENQIIKNWEVQAPGATDLKTSWFNKRRLLQRKIRILGVRRIASCFT